MPTKLKDTVGKVYELSNQSNADPYQHFSIYKYIND